MYRNILVPVALGHGETTQQAFAIARHLRSEGGSITALHVVEALPAYILAELPSDISANRRDTALAGLKEEAGSGVRPVVVTGHAAMTILEYAKENKADCIVIASHQPGIQDYFLGSTAARVVRHAHCAVHVVR